MRTHNSSTRILLWMSLAATVLLWPAEALAQRGGRGGGGHGGGGGQSAGRGGGGGGGRVSRPVVVQGRGYRPVYYRNYYQPYYYSSFYWGGPFGWYPFYPYGFYGYGGYGGYGYDRPWYDDLGALRVEVKPREAQVYVDGYFAGLVDDFDGISQRLRAKPGEHQIEVYLPGFQSIRERMLFRPGSSLRLKSVMQPLGTGEAQSPKPEPIAPPPSPPGASSNDPGNYDPGPARGPVRRPGVYRQAPPDAVGVDPAPAAPPEERSTQTRSGYGTLSIRVQPTDAVVLVDGEKWDGSGDRQRLVIELSEGTHRIEVQKNGFTTYSTDVRVRSGQVTTINVSLTSAREI